MVQRCACRGRAPLNGRHLDAVEWVQTCGGSGCVGVGRRWPAWWPGFVPWGLGMDAILGMRRGVRGWREMGRGAGAGAGAGSSGVGLLWVRLLPSWPPTRALAALSIPSAQPSTGSPPRESPSRAGARVIQRGLPPGENEKKASKRAGHDDIASFAGQFVLCCVRLPASHPNLHACNVLSVCRQAWNLIAAGIFHSAEGEEWQ